MEEKLFQVSGMPLPKRGLERDVSGITMVPKAEVGLRVPTDIYYLLLPLFFLDSTNHQLPPLLGQLLTC